MRVKYETCPYCNGKGYESDRKNCHHCGGKGKIEIYYAGLEEEFGFLKRISRTENQTETDTQEDIRYGWFFVNPRSSNIEPIDDCGEPLFLITETDSEGLREVRCFVNAEKKISRKKGPAYFLYEVVEKDNELAKVCVRKIYLQNGICHREDGAAFIECDHDGKIIEIRYYRNGKLHREDGPAYIRNFYSGKKHMMAWYKDGKLHREDGPAYMKFSEDGKLEEVRYFVEGKLHREDGPAVEVHKGDLRAFVYYSNGVLLKEVVIMYNGDHVKEVDYVNRRMRIGRIADDGSFKVINEFSWK